MVARWHLFYHGRCRQYRPNIQRPNRCHDSTDCGAQSFRPGGRLGPSERICCYSVLRSISSYLRFKTQRWNLYTLNTWKIQQNGPSWKTNIIKQSCSSRSHSSGFLSQYWWISNCLSSTIQPRYTFSDVPSDGSSCCHI